MKSIGLTKFLRTLCYGLGLILALVGCFSVSAFLVRGIVLFVVGFILLIVGSLFADHLKALKASSAG